jgi:hypothetical protein
MERNWLINFFRKAFNFFSGKSKHSKTSSPDKNQTSSGLDQNPLKPETKKTTSISTGSSPDKKAVDNSKEKKTETSTTRKETETSDADSTSRQKSEPQRLRITGHPFKVSITETLNESLLSTLRKVNYDPNNRFKQNVPLTFPLVLMPAKNTDIKPPVNGKSSNKGMTEESFCRDFLMKYFQNMVYDSLTVFKGITPYEPDLAIIDSTSGKNIFIDIEIDEPYDGVTRNPTHFRTTLGGTADDNRNKGFTDRGWMVIRFAEEQIVSSPNECAKYIGEVIKSVNPLFTSSCLNFSTSLKSISMWTDAEARVFAAAKKREKYLGISEFFTSGGTRDDKIMDSTLGKEIESRINSIMVGGSISNPAPKVVNPPVYATRPKTIPTPIILNPIAPPIIASTFKPEEPKITSKTDKPSQPSPKPYAN